MIALLSNARLELGESSVPLGADSSFTLDTSESTVSKADIAQAIDGVARAGDAAVALVSLPPAGASGARVLLRFGDVSPPGNPSSVWALPERNGGIAPFDARSESSLEGQYVVWGVSVVEPLRAWAETSGVTVTEREMPGAVALTAQALFTGTAFVPLLAIVLALVVLLVVHAGRQLRANTQKYLNGVSPLRIGTESAARILATILLPVTVIGALSVGVVALRSGWEFVPEYLVGLAHLVLPIFAVLLLCSLVLSAATRPSAAIIARRSTGGRGLRIAGEVTKALAVGTTLVLLPTAVTGLLNADQFRAEAEIWQQFDGVVSVNNFGAEPGSAEDIATGNAYASLVADSGSDVLLVMDWSTEADIDPALLGDRFGGVVVVNRSYLDRASAGAASMSSVEPSSLTPELSAEIAATLGLQMADPIVDADDVFGRAQPAEIAEGTALPVITGRYLDGMVMVDRPLLLVVDDLTVLSPNFLLAASSKSGVLFPEADQLRAALAAHDLERVARGVDLVATQGLLDLQNRQLRAAYALAAVTILALTLVMCLWTSARSYVLGRAKTFLPLALNGHGVLRAMRRRLIAESLLIVAFWVLSLTVARASDTPTMSVLVMTVAAAIALVLTLFFHGRAFARIVRRTLLRQNV